MYLKSVQVGGYIGDDQTHEEPGPSLLKPVGIGTGFFKRLAAK
jgi:hypothetical protein